MNSTRLSICIATYNRADYIGETLDSILPQLTDAVEVVIVDGASTDDTEKAVRLYAAKCPNIKYVRLPAKGGVDNDYDLSAEHASGEYCWFFTDDDVLNPGAVLAVLKQLDAAYPLIIVNANVKDSKLETLLEEKRLPVPSDVVYPPSDFEKFFLETVDYMSFIGCVVVKRSVWLERERRKYYGLEFIHLGVIFQRPLNLPVLVMAEPYISIRLGNAQWSSRVFEIRMIKWPKLIWGLDAVSGAAKKKVSSPQPWRNPAKLAMLRAQGNYTSAEYRKFIRPSAPWASRIIPFLVSCVPGRAFNLLALIYHLLRNRRSKMPFFILRQSRFYWLKFNMN